MYCLHKWFFFVVELSEKSVRLDTKFNSFTRPFLWGVQSLPAHNILSDEDEIETKSQKASITKSSTLSVITKVTWVISATWSDSCQKFGQMKCFQRILLTPERKNIFLAQTVIEVWQQNWNPKSLNRKTRMPVSIPHNNNKKQQQQQQEQQQKGREIVISRDDIPWRLYFSQFISIISDLPFLTRSEEDVVYEGGSSVIKKLQVEDMKG